jgi:glycerophosphoryl diester phosphodiesterase
MHPAVSAARPLIFAHRGGAGLFPENTIPAFDRGLALGADGLEFDVHLSRDGVPVVHHDRLLDRTTDATGPISAKDVAQLTKVNACAGFVRSGRQWDGGFACVPTLREVLDRYRDARIIIELKGASATLARAVVDEVRQANAFERICIGGYSWRALNEVRQYEPRLATSASHIEVRGAVYGGWVGRRVRQPAFAAFQVPERVGFTRIVSRRFIRIAHDAQIAVQVWTVDEPTDIRRLLEWGVDAIMTDRPDVALKALKEWLGDG